MHTILRPSSDFLPSLRIGHPQIGVEGGQEERMDLPIGGVFGPGGEG